MAVREKIRELVEKGLREANLPVVEFGVERPKDEDHGDWASNVAMTVWGKLEDKKKKEFRSPRDLAEALVEKLLVVKFEFGEIEKIEVAGPGFINFYLNDKYFLTELGKVLQSGEEYGKGDWGRNKLAIVEYSSPNIAKPFTIGHLRSTIIGDAIANLLEAGDWRVLRDNHVGDWGTQFGKLLCAIEKWGDVDEIEKSERPVKELVRLYVKFHKEAEKDSELEDEGRKWFKKLEDGDKRARELWQKCVDWSWKEFEKIYSLLGVKFSQEFNQGKGLGESFFEDKMEAVLEELEEKKLLQVGKEGAKLVFFPEEIGLPPLMVLKKDGTTLYATRDLATDKYRLRYEPELVLNEVGAEQSLYFRQLFEVEYMLGWYKPGQRVHVGHGLYRFKEGKMSTRRGNVIWLEDVLEEALGRAKKIVEEKNPDLENRDEVARVVGIGALKWNDLKGEPRRDIVFDWDQVLAMEGNSGPYVQYTYARGRSVLRKLKIKNEGFKVIIQNSKFGSFDEVEKGVVRWLVRYPEVVEEAGRSFAPQKVAGFLYELATRYNKFYNQCRVVGDEREEVRAAITAAVVQVLRNGLGLLGIEVVERM